jgi:DNA sulfur modification protein DndE
MSSAFTTKEIDRIRYRPTKAAEDILGDFRSRLGLSDKATAARLAIGRSLHEGSPAREEMVAIEGAEKGAAIEGVHLFADDSDIWASAICCIEPAILASAADFRSLVEFHWHRGAALLEKDFIDAGRSDVDFLVQLAGRLPANSQLPQSGPSSRTLGKVVSKAVSIQALRNVAPWAINAAGGNGLVVISGRPGSGKSQLALDMLAQAAAQGVRFLFFDLKGELEVTAGDQQQREKREKFLAATGASYLRLIDQSLPINPFSTGRSAAETAQIASEIAHLCRCFASQLGANQEKAIRDVYQDLSTPDIDSLVSGIADQGGNGVGVAILEKISSFRVFSPSATSLDVEDWLGQSQVVDFKGLGSDTEAKSLVVAFVLNTIMRRLNRQIPVADGVQPLQMILFVDEAHLLLPKEGKAGLLGSLARQGRSWGFPVWLASQDADAFVTRGQNAVDFSELADCGIHLSPGTLSETQQRQILGQVINRKLADGEGVMRLKGTTAVGAIRQYYSDNGEVTPLT